MSTADSRAEALARYGKLPLYFEENRGQAAAPVRYLARGPGYQLLLLPTEQHLLLRSGGNTAQAEVLTVGLAGAHARPQLNGEQPREGRSHYLNRSPAVTGVPHYGRVRYEEVYRGIDLVFYGNPQQLEYDFVIAPGADPGQIRLRYSGADHAEIDASGNLVLKLGGGEVVQKKPLVYQPSGDGKVSVAAAFRLDEKNSGPDVVEVAFALGDFDPGQTLVIDPVLVYATYLGGDDDDYAYDIDVDSTGSAYITGQTFSTDFDTTESLSSPFRPLALTSGDAFVAKLNPAGDALVYASYIGGALSDFATAIKVDDAGQAHVAGGTSSPDFNFPAPPDPTELPGFLSLDAFVVKLNAAGDDLLYTHLFRGSSDERATAIALDGQGNAYVTGLTDSDDFPTVTPLQPDLAGSIDAFVAKLDDGGNVVYATYLGGSGSEDLTDADIAVSSGGEAYVAGGTHSSNFPVMQQIEGVSGAGDVFVSHLNAAGSALVSSTYLGGSGIDYASGIALDSAGNIYIAGTTDSTDFDLTTARIEGDSPGFDGFIAKLNAASNALIYSTYLGGSGDDHISDIAVDALGRAYVTGATTSSDFNLGIPIEADSDGNAIDAFLSKLAPTGDALIYSSYLGGSDIDTSYALELDGDGAVYIAGATSSANFDVLGPYETAQGGSDAFIAKIVETGGEFSFSAPVFALSEGGDASGSVLVQRVGDAVGAVSVTCRSGASIPMMPETASAGFDFVSVNSVLNWADGDRMPKPCPVTLIDDSDPEPTQTINLELSDPTNRATLGQPQVAIVNILDDDTGGGNGTNVPQPPAVLSFSAAAFSGSEETRTAIVTVNRSGSLAEAVSVFVQAANGSAASPGDFVNRSDFLVWQAGDSSPRTVTLEVYDDSLIENRESFTVSLTSVQGNGQLAQPLTATVSIDENDTPQSVTVTERGRQTKISLPPSEGELQTVTLLPQAPAGFSQGAGRDLDYLTGLDVVAEVQGGSSARLAKAGQPLKLTVRPPGGTANPSFVICVKLLCTALPPARITTNAADPLAKDIELDEGDPMFDGDETENGMLVARMLLGTPKLTQAASASGGGSGGGALGLSMLLLGFFGGLLRLRRRAVRVRQGRVI